MKNFAQSISLIAVLTMSFASFGQNGGTWNNWYFGWFGALNFDNGTPTSVSGSSMISYEGCVSQSDDQGNLLFYSDGGKETLGFTGPGGVRNKNHQMMPNGEMSNNEAGCDSSPQSALVIKKSATEYYMFTIGCSNSVGLRKSVIDMSLDGGLGDVTVVGDPILDNPSTLLAEALTATRHANGIDYWLYVHSRVSNSFYTFLITPTSVVGPTIQNVGGSITNYGQMKINVRGNKLTFSNQIFDLDKSTGTISNPIDLNLTTPWGHSFSASGDYLYIGTIDGINQFDMNAPNIPASGILVNVGGPTGAFQLGPDLKIYVPASVGTPVGVINFPELAGAACDYNPTEINLVSGTCQMGLPNFIDSDLNEHVGIEESELVSTLKLFPNPTSSLIYFEKELTADDLTITSIDGSVVLGWELLHKSLNVEKLSEGVYIINHNGSSAKFIKRN